MTAAQAAEIFQALSNEHRVQIVQRLLAKAIACRDPESCDLSESCCDVGELAQASGISLPTVSYHLKELRHTGLITMQRRGRRIYCAVNTALLNEAFAYVRLGSVAEPGCGKDNS